MLSLRERVLKHAWEWEVYMSKTIITAAGTSAARALNLGRKHLLEWINEQETSGNRVEYAANLLFLQFRDIPPEGDNLKNSLSAEIHSLVRIGIDSSDRILLLASNTDDGWCCALAIEQYLHHYWKGIYTKVESVPGLQVNDAKLFRTQGVVEFVRRINKEVSDYGSENIILNPTAGFKALVPYTVLVGMLKGIQCQYIFEQSTSLLELPPLPVEFRRSQFEAYRNLFEEIERETSITQVKWEQDVSYAERSWFEPLIEISEGQVTLSAVGFLFLEEIRRPSVLVPFLSQKAIRECLDDLAPLDNCDPFRFLSRIARDKKAFREAEHINMGDGLRWLKPGRTTDRYLVSVADWCLLVWRAIREDQIGENYANIVQVNPKLDRDRATYKPFMRMEFLP
jgi:putative CRISPR-associated protein (TIGR02619 family)